MRFGPQPDKCKLKDEILIKERQIPITAIVSTKNEERAIGDCLVNLAPLAQIIVVDSLSEDGTQDIVREMGHELVTFDWNGRYPKKKQWCLDNLDIRHPWVLFVDADERPTEQLLNELRELTTKTVSSACDAYDIPLLYVFSGNELRHGHTVVKRALMKRAKATFPVIDDLAAPGMGELEGHYQPTIDGKVGRLKGRLLHHDPDPVSTWIRRHNSYSDWEAYLRTHADAALSVRRLRSRQGRLFDRIPGKPLAFFGYSYFIKGGFLDGRAGFDYAIALSFYYWLISLKVSEVRRSKNAQTTG
jgi:glycosyltransferase involved in cell wall biosynthesis